MALGDAQRLLAKTNGSSIVSLLGWRREWLAADWAVLGVGGIATMIYASSVPATMDITLRASGTRYLDRFEALNQPARTRQEAVDSPALR